MNCAHAIVTGLVAAAALWGAGCRTPAPEAGPAPHPEVRRLCAAGRRVWDLGEAERAAELYRQALLAARASGHMESVAAAAGSLAACRFETGDLPGALDAIREGRAALARVGRRNADLAVLEGRILLALERTAPARAAAAEALAAGGGVAARLLLAECALREGQTAAAAGHAADAASSIARNAPAALRGWLAETLARVRMAEGQTGEAASAFESAAAWRGSAGQRRQVVRNLAAAATAYAAAGHPLKAADCAYRAAAAELDPSAAESWLTRAEGWLDDSADARRLRDLIAALRAERSRATATGSP